MSVDHVSKRFPLPDGKGEFTVLEDVSLTVRSSEVVALLGRSGSGKSTLLRIMSGLIRPSQGTVRIKGSRCGEPTPIWPWCSRASRCFPGSRCRTTWNWVWPPGMSNATSAGNAPSRPSTSSASMVSRMRTPGSSPAG